MSRFWTSLTPGPGPKPKNDDSVQAWSFKMGRFGLPERRLPPVLALLRGPGQQSQRHGAAIPMAQRRPRDTPSSNPHGTAPHTAHTRRARNADPNGTEFYDAPRDDARRRAGTQQTKRTRVQPPDPQTINGNPSLRIRENNII